MTKEKRVSLFSYIAAVVILLLALPKVYDCLRDLFLGGNPFYDFEYGFLLGILTLLRYYILPCGLILSAIGFLIKNTPLKVTSFVLYLVVSIFTLIALSDSNSYGIKTPVVYFIENALVLFHAILLIMAITTDKKVFTIVAAACGVAYAIIKVSDYNISYQHGVNVYTYRNISVMLFPLVTAAIITLTLVKKQKASKTYEVVDTGSTADKLLKLKVLKDSGAISQEEFDAKKKQLLDL